MKDKVRWWLEERQRNLFLANKNRANFCHAPTLQWWIKNFFSTSTHHSTRVSVNKNFSNKKEVNGSILIHTHFFRCSQKWQDLMTNCVWTAIKLHSQIKFVWRSESHFFKGLCSQPNQNTKKEQFRGMLEQQQQWNGVAITNGCPFIGRPKWKP